MSAGSTHTLVLLLVAVGIGSVLQTCRGWITKKLLKTLNERHERECKRRSERFAKRIVRDVPTGAVGWCVSVCVQQPGWRDLVWPRWRATVVFDPALACLVALPPAPVVTESPGALFALLLGFFAYGAAMARINGGAGSVIALDRIAIAPASDASAFTAAMEKARAER